MVLDRDVVERGGQGWYEKRDAGSGPFMLREWVHNDHVTLTADPQYFLGAPKVARVELPIVTQAATRLAEYQASQLDLVQVPLADFQRIQADPTLGKQLIVFPRAQFIWLRTRTKEKNSGPRAKARSAPLAVSVPT